MWKVSLFVHAAVEGYVQKSAFEKRLEKAQK